jgi:hypothetical protein
LPPLEVNGSWLPEQVDITSIYLDAASAKSKNGRGRINITRVFTPEEIANLEDEIATAKEN